MVPVPTPLAGRTNSLRFGRPPFRGRGTLTGVTDDRSARLDRLTDRWRSRHDARVAAEGRQPADAEREARARASFPYRTETPAAYAERHGAAMFGYTYDAYIYSDPALDAWLRELGEILAQRQAPASGRD